MFLPENCAFMGSSSDSKVESAEDLEGPSLKLYRQVAKDEQLWLSLGGFPLKTKDPSKLSNSQIIIDDAGEIRSVYNKTHLFDVDIPGNVMNESKFVEAGSEIVPPIDTPIGRLGLSICYDIRFPSLYRALAVQGAQIMTVPSAFLVKTGAAHWDVLLRARAIENQCYIIAAA